MAKLKSLAQLNAELASGALRVVVVAPPDPYDQFVDELSAPSRVSTTPAPQCFSGFNAFVGGGSFEVFYVADCTETRAMGATDPGWYWWSCWPGCLPDGEPSGPFPTAEAAYLDAIGE